MDSAAALEVRGDSAVVESGADTGVELSDFAVEEASGLVLSGIGPDVVTAALVAACVISEGAAEGLEGSTWVLASGVDCSVDAAAVVDWSVSADALEVATDGLSDVSSGV